MTTRRTDAAVAAALALLGLATLVLTTWIGFRSWEALAQVVRRPLVLQQTQALVTGLLSSNLLVLQVLLLARLPWLERAWGREALTRWHRRLGHWSFWLLIAHVLLFVLQRSLREQPFGAAMAALFLTEPWMLPATIGTALLVLVVVTSIAQARRRLRYETWHLIHLYAYVGMGLALPHQLVSVDFQVGWIEAYWWGLYLGALAAVLAFRVALPLARSARHRLRVVEVRPEAAGAVSVVVAGRQLEGLGARSGQFFVWRFLGGRGWTRGHPYSLSGAPTADRLRLTVGGAGDGARRTAGLAVGTRVLVEGPYGGLPALRRRHPRLVLLAAGVGVTPFRALLEDLPLAPGEATLVHRVTDASQALLREELEELAARRGIELVLLAGPRRGPYSWLPTGVGTSAGDSLLALVPDVAEADVLLCGPPGWTAAVRRAARAVGVARRDLHQEDFSW